MLFICDLIVVSISFFFALYLRFGVNTSLLQQYWYTLIFLYIISFTIFYLGNLYNHRIYINKERVFYKIIRIWLVIGLLYIITGFVTNFSFLIQSRVFIAEYGLISLLLFVIFRIILAPKWLNSYYSNVKRRLLCVCFGSDDKFERLSVFLKNNPVLGINPVLTDCTYYNKDISMYDNYNEVFIWSNAEDFEILYSEIKPLIDLNKPVHVASKLFNEINLKWDLYHIDSVPVYSFQKKRWGSYRNFIKRLIDIVFSLITLIVLSPIFGLVACMIKIDSKGPVLFTQRRCGLNGKEFTLYKFRTMYHGADKDKEREKKIMNYIENKENKGKIINEQNITRIGRILRKTTIDELPQFFNVIKGEMSLIGPRPGIYYEVRHYRYWHKDRLLVKPGMSGLWGVYGRGHMPFDTTVFLDLVYIINRSISMDIKLILQAIPAVFLGRGAY